MTEWPKPSSSPLKKAHRRYGIGFRPVNTRVAPASSRCAQGLQARAILFQPPAGRRVSLIRRHPRGLTVVEAAFSVVLVGVMLVAALNAAGASKLAMSKLSDRERGMLLAQELMTEILALEYEDSAFGPGSFGRSGAENATGNRSLYDDVDDYYNWSASPPEGKDGAVKPDLTGWQRSVVVAWVNANDVSTAIGTDQRVKRITVTVSKNSVSVAQLVAFRAAAGDSLVVAAIN